MFNPSLHGKVKNTIKRGGLCFTAALVLCCCVALPALSGCAEDTGVKTELFLAADEATSAYLENVVRRFNEKSEDYCVTVTAYKDEDVEKYYVSHESVTCDIVTFTDIHTANSLTDILQPLNRLEVVGNYQSTMINNMKDESGNLYAIPSPGTFYSICYNLDALKGENYSEPPATISAETTMAQRISDAYGCVCLASTDDESLEDILMSYVVPMFASSTSGVDFLKKYYRGETTISGGDYKTQWEQLFGGFYNLFATNFYDKSASLGSEDYSDEFAAGQALAYFKSDSSHTEGELDFDYGYYPFAGERDGEDWLIVSPHYFLSATVEAFDDEVRRDGVTEFLEYFSSPEGQAEAVNHEHGNTDTHVSFTRDFNQQFTGVYAAFSDAYKSGRVYLSDYFTSIFSGSGSLLRQYIDNRIGVSDLIAGVDEMVKESLEEEEETLTITSDFDYSENIVAGETAIGDFVTDAARSAFGSVKALFLSPSSIKCNLLAGEAGVSTIVSTVFEDTRLVLVSATGETLIQIVNTNLANLSTTDDYGLFMMCSGIKADEDGNITFTNGSAINESTKYQIAVPADMLEKLEEKYGYEWTTGTVKSLSDLLTAYLTANTTLTPPSLDLRYGTSVLMSEYRNAQGNND